MRFFIILVILIFSAQTPMLTKDAFSQQMWKAGARQRPEITDSEYRYLLQNQKFANVDYDFNATYKYCLNKTKKNERKHFTSGWVKSFNIIKEDAAKRFKKMSPAYIQFLIDNMTLMSYNYRLGCDGDGAAAKADGYFDTLYYDDIHFDGIIKPENRIKRD